MKLEFFDDHDEALSFSDKVNGKVIDMDEQVGERRYNRPDFMTKYVVKYDTE